MSNEKMFLVVVSVLVVIGGMVFNFQEFLMGSPATMKNVVVTAIYIGGWVWLMASVAKREARGVARLFTVFWALTFMIAVVTAYVNVTGAQADWALPFAGLLMGQWYGLTLVGSYLTTSIVVAVVSMGMIMLPVAMQRVIRKAAM